jgi:hypothetical protein
MMTDTADLVAEVNEVVAQIRLLLAGRGPEVQSAALADLVATLLAGFQGPGKLEAREAMLELWLETMRELIPTNEPTAQ